MEPAEPGREREEKEMLNALSAEASRNGSSLILPPMLTPPKVFLRGLWVLAFLRGVCLVVMGNFAPVYRKIQSLP